MKGWRFSNHSRWNVFAPLPAIVIAINDGYDDFSLSMGWLFFACEFIYNK